MASGSSEIRLLWSLDAEAVIPIDLYDERLLIDNGKSVTKRLVGGGELEMVDALYFRNIEES